jgi:plastocyanin
MKWPPGVNIIFVLGAAVSSRRETLRRQKQYTEALAKSCVYTHGYGVYKARLLWSNSEPGLEYNDYRICTEGSNKRNVFGPIFEYISGGDSVSQEASSMKLHKVNVYPNPANNLLNFKFDYEREGEVRIEFYDLTGRRVKIILAANSSSHIEVSTNEFISGLYTFKFYFNNGLLNVGKVNIIK